MLPVSPPLASADRTPRSARTLSAASFPVESPARTSLAAPENSSGTARHLPGAGNRRRDRQRSEPQSFPLARLSPARPQPRDRTRSADTRSPEGAIPLPPAAYLHSSPTICRLPILPLSAISESAAAFGCRPLDVQRTSSATRD